MMPVTDHPLGIALRAAAAGTFPAVDGLAEIVPADADGTCAVVCFTGHAFVLTDREEALAGFTPDGFGAAMDPGFLVALAGRGGVVGSTDVVLVGHGLGRRVDALRLVERTELEHHPRVRRALQHRRDVRVLGDATGLVTIGRGLVGRTELSVELTAAEHGGGAGRALVRAALHELAVGELVFVQVAAGNAASLRVFLACGFVPIASEVLIERA